MESRPVGMTWPLVERVTVRKLSGGSFIGEARTHASFATGEIKRDPVAAMESAEAALDAQLRPKYEAWNKRSLPASDEFEDLL